MKKKGKKMWTVLTSIFTVLLVVMLVGSLVAFSFSTSINAFLLSETYRIEPANDNIDTNYFPDEWEGYDDWFHFYEEELCERVEAEGAVLLKNDNNALPLKSDAKVSLFSHSSVDMIYGGTGSGSVNTSEAPNLRDGLEQAGASINGDLWTFYNVGAASSYMRQVPGLSSNAAVGDYSINESPWSLIEEENGLEDTFTSYGDAAIFVLARSGGEGRDLATDTATDEGTNGDYLALSTNEKDTLKALNDLKEDGVFNKVIVLLNSSNAMNADFVDNPDYGIDACLWIGGVGAYGNNAVGDILMGKINPSGRLVDTYLYDNFANPSLVNFGDCVYPNAEEMGLLETNDDKQTQINYVVNQEGIYIGYKYFETRYADQVEGQGNAGTIEDFDYAKTVYKPFGFGMSYTNFDYSDYSVEEQEDQFVVNATVTNTGDVAGKHTVQIYMQKPYTDYDKENKVEKSAVELVGYGKTSKLAPGQSQTVTIEVPKKLMKSYDAYGKKTYIVDDGDYYLALGKDAHDAMNNILAKKGYKADQTLMTEEGNEALSYVYTQENFDDSTYAVSDVTGNPITNQFEDTDLNLYEGPDTVTYLSRSDWMGTYPKEMTVVTVSDKMANDILTGYTPIPKGTHAEDYELPTYGAKNGLTLAMMIGLPYDDPKWEDLLDQMTYQEQHDILVNAFHNTRTADSIAKPATVETNGPQGITDSFFGGGKAGTAYPAEVVMASTWNNDIMAEIGYAIGNQGLKTRTHGVYAPAANIHRNAYCGRNYEYFSEDAFLSGRLMTPEVAAIQEQGVYVFMKHFALNDQETHRGGVMVWSGEQAIREGYLDAYQPAVEEAHAKGVMTIMNFIGTKWGGAHNGLLTQVYRNEWGADGLVITDFSSNSTYTLQTRGLDGGVDIWDGFSATDIDDRADDPFIAQKVRTAMHRLLYVQANSSAMNGISPGDKIVSIMPWWQKALIAIDAVLAVLAILSAFMLFRSKKSL